MNNYNWCICWFLTHILLGILIFKGLIARPIYKSFGVKGLSLEILSKKDITNLADRKFQKHTTWNYRSCSSVLCDAFQKKKGRTKLQTADK
jgi:hypothetical protein